MALTNGNITLRALEPSDVELLYNWENDAAVWKVSNTRTPLSKFALANYIKNNDRDIWELKEMRLMIEDENCMALGTVELFDFDPYHSRAGLGIIVYDQSKRRNGIAWTALGIISEYALTELGLMQLYVNIAATNVPSLELFRKAGFNLVGVKKRWLKTLSGRDDEHLLQKFLSE